MEDTVHAGRQDNRPKRVPMKAIAESHLPNHCISIHSFPVGGQNGEVCSLYLSEGRSSALHTTCGFRPAGKVGVSYGDQARYRNLWNQELGGSASCVWGRR